MPAKSWAEAKSLGVNRYFTGKSCKRGHVAERRADNRNCVMCDPQVTRAAKRKWRLNNPAKMEEARHRWAEDNVRRIKEKQHEWWISNRDKAVAYSAKRRAIQKGAAIGDRTEYNAYIKWAKTTPDLRCSYCNEVVPPERRDIDHVIPLSRGGADSVDNLCVACLSCNRQKHAKTAEEFTALKLAS